MENTLFIKVWTLYSIVTLLQVHVQSLLSTVNMFQASAWCQVGDRPLSDPYICVRSLSHVCNTRSQSQTKLCEYLVIVFSSGCAVMSSSVVFSLEDYFAFSTYRLFKPGQKPHRLAASPAASARHPIEDKSTRDDFGIHTEQKWISVLLDFVELLSADINVLFVAMLQLQMGMTLVSAN